MCLDFAGVSGMCATDSPNPNPNESPLRADFGGTTFGVSPASDASASCFAILFLRAMFAAAASLSSTANGIFSCERLNGWPILPGPPLSAALPSPL